MRQLRNLAKRIVFSALANPFALARRLRRSAEANQITILNFHRVAPNDRSGYPPLDPALFADVIAFCAKQFEILTFDQIRSKEVYRRPRAVISFDDGYRDFVDYALPILRRHNVKPNHNFIIASLSSGLPPANVLLQDFIGKASTTEVGALGAALGSPQRKGEDRLAFGMRISSAVKTGSIADQKAQLERARSVVDLDKHATPMMSLADARDVAGDIEIGAHSFEHANLIVESDAYVEDDAAKCRRFFAQEFNSQTPIYALPNGYGDERIFRILRNANFDTILLTGERYAQAVDKPLPRFSMDGLSTSELRFRATGYVR